MKASAGLLKSRPFWIVCAALLAMYFSLAWSSFRQERLNHALIQAIERDDAVAVRALLAQGADPNADASGEVPLWIRLEDLFHHHKESHTPVLFLAINVGGFSKKFSAGSSDSAQEDATSVAIIQALLDKGARPDVREDGRTPLDTAIYLDLTNAALVLARRGAKPSRKINGQPALMVAVSNLNPTLVKLVLDSGGVPDAQTGQWSLKDAYNALDRPDKPPGTGMQVMQALLEAGVSPDTIYPNAPLLYSAVERKRYEVVRLLLEHGANPNPKPGVGDLPLLWYALDAKPQMLQMLLDAGADADAVNAQDGEPLLWYAVIHKIAEPPAERALKVKLLLDHGADPLRPMPGAASHAALWDYAAQHAADWHISGDILALLQSAAAKRPLPNLPAPRRGRPQRG
ncbi:MAG TPA: hypothetical protein VFB38_16745 [Chthonomonadaceae bacterium]|nr:hypothetical protein [Chthonomonadaceae bacterium]